MRDGGGYRHSERKEHRGRSEYRMSIHVHIQGEKSTIKSPSIQIRDRYIHIQGEQAGEGDGAASLMFCAVHTLL